MCRENAFSIQPVLSAYERLDIVNEDLRLIQRTDGLTFGTDAYLLAAMLRSNEKATGVELGGGTGIVSMLALTRNKLSHVHIWEIQPEYAALCRRNSILNRLSHRITVHEGDVRSAQSADHNGEVDVVFSNPPYMLPESGRKNANRKMNIARREENGSIADFCAAAARLLKYGGCFYTVYRPDRLADLFSALRQNKLEPKYTVLVYPSTQNPPCLVLVEARKGGAPQLSVAPPLMIYTDKRTGLYTAEMERVYAECSLRFLFP